MGSDFFSLPLQRSTTRLAEINSNLTNVMASFFYRWLVLLFPMLCLSACEINSMVLVKLGTPLTYMYVDTYGRGVSSQLDALHGSTVPTGNVSECTLPTLSYLKYLTLIYIW